MPNLLRAMYQRSLRDPCTPHATAIEPLEPRMMFNGTLPSSPADAVSTVVYSSISEAEITEPADHERAIRHEAFDADGPHGTASTQGLSATGPTTPDPDSVSFIYDADSHDGTLDSRAAFSLVATDLDGDGVLDLMSGTTAWLGKGDGTFREASPTVVADLVNSPTVFLAGDLDGNGLGDLVIYDYYFEDDDRLLVLLVQPDGIIEISQEITTEPGTQNPRGTTASVSGGVIEFGDLDGDGNQDMVTASYLLEPTRVSSLNIYFGKGDGTFEQPINRPVSDGSIWNFAIADFDRDGSEDIAVVAGFSDLRLIYFGGPSRSFEVATAFGDTSSITLIDEDFDGDGITDLGIGTSILFGNGDGTFELFTGPPWPTFPYGIAAADLDGNGTEDIIVSEHYPGSIYVGFMAPDRTMTDFVEFDAGINDSGLLVPADLDRDGDVDLINIGIESYHFEPLINQRIPSPVDDPPVDDPPLDDSPADGPPTDDPPVDDPPIEDPPMEDPPADDIPTSTVVGFDKMKKRAAEAGRKAKFRVVREGDLSKKTRVRLDFDGKAKYRKDYDLKVSGGGKMNGKRLVIPKGKKAVKITVIPQDDRKREGNESIKISVRQTAAVSLPINDVPSLRALFKSKIKDND
ncbi:MAG: VCBS repeat-containing protein [Planctomycetota bacterium]